jgi:hypothetical protein
MDGLDNRRRHDRIPVRGGVLAAVPLAGRPRELALRLVNVSESGLAMSGVDRLDVGSRLRVLAGIIGLEGVIEGAVDIRWSVRAPDGWLVGAEFNGPSVSRDSVIASLRRRGG